MNEPKPPHPETIKSRLRIAFRSVRAFEREKALPAYSVRDVLRGRSVRATAVAIAAALDEPLDTLFPGRFGGPVSDSKDNTSQKRDAHRQIAEAR